MLNGACLIEEDAEAAATDGFDIPDQPPRPAGAVDVRPGARHGLRVLLIDTDEAHRDAAAGLVRAALASSCAIDVSRDAADAAERIESDLYDLHLISLRPPLADALALVRAAAASRAPAIALAETPDDEIDILALGAGASESLAMPGLSRRVLAKAVRHTLLRHHTLGDRRRRQALADREMDRLRSLQEVSHRLARRACHAIRSPLTVIKTYSSILLGELPLDDDQARFLRTIMRRVDDLGHMVDNLLDASHVACDLVGTHRQAIGVGDLLEELRPGLEQMAAARDIRFRIDLKGALPEAFCDRQDIGRAIQNLVADACKAAGQGGRVVVWAQHEPDIQSVRVGITDDRPEATEMEPPSFDAGYRQPDQAEAHGPDLALHVVSELVRINLGKLSVTPMAGGGMIAAFTLPTVALERILSAHFGVLERGRQTVSTVSIALASVAAGAGEQGSRAIVEFLWSVLRSDDLVVPLGPGLWALCVSCGPDDLAKIVDRIARASRTRTARPLPELALRTVGGWPLSAAPDLVAAEVLAAPSTPPSFALRARPRIPLLDAAASRSLSVSTALSA